MTGNSLHILSSIVSPNQRNRSVTFRLSILNISKIVKFKPSTSFDMRGELYRISGADLTQIDGINVMSAQTIIAEVGVDLGRFPTEAHFASFLSLCPDNQITGGKVLRRAHDVSRAV